MLISVGKCSFRSRSAILPGKAQARLCARYRRLVAKGKRTTVATTAIAREIAAFLWDIARHVEPAQMKAASGITA